MKIRRLEVIVQEAATSLLAGWESFYIIIGSSAAALIGLQFVAIALLTEIRRRSSTREIDAFATPTIVHLSTALLVSAILSAPWPAMSEAGIALAICGFAGLVYVAIVIRRARLQTGYKLVAEDWVWHLTLPLIAYTSLFAAGINVNRHAVGALFDVAGTTLLLLFIAIHNSWDTVTYIAISHVADASS